MKIFIICYIPKEKQKIKDIKSFRKSSTNDNKQKDIKKLKNTFNKFNKQQSL